MTATPSEVAALNEVRADVLRRPGLVGAGLRQELSEAYDTWLRTVFTPVDGVALAAVGGLGRREPAPYSDLDLVLLYEGRVDGLAELADRIWYPIWDSRIGLDHSVRTPAQALDVARDDVKALMGLLDIRHIAGEPELTAKVRAGVYELWRSTAAKRLPELRVISRERWALAGEAAFLLEPNLKESRGGLRDAQGLRALASAQLVDYPVWVREAYPVLLDARGELHRITGRDEDVLHLQEHDAVAAALGYVDGPRADGDRTAAAQQARDAMLRRVNEAARAIAQAVDIAWRRAEATQSRSRWRIGGRSGPQRVGLADNVVNQDGELVLARDAVPATDPGLVLRLARVAAEHDLPIAPFTLERLAAEAPALPEAWPPPARTDFVGALGAGRPAIDVFEALDQAGLLVALVPEWDAVRSRAQHNPVHRYTVDRHLLGTAAAAAERGSDTERRDVLLVGALLHDIGKGYPPEDHSVAGERHAATVATRMGFEESDVALIAALARHHLLLPNTATRRDPDDPRTIEIVRGAVNDDRTLLTLLHELAVADAAATGPAAWSEWKARLVSELVRRTRAAIGGSAPPASAPLDEARRVLAERGELAVELDGEDTLLVAIPDAAGGLSRTTGVLALHSLDVLEASVRIHADMAVNRFVVKPRFGRLPDPALVRADLARALRHELPLAERVAEKERTYSRRPSGTPSPRPRVLWFDDDSSDATVVEFRGADELGLLYRIATVLDAARLDVRSARISSLAGAVVDAFYVTDGAGRPLDAEARAALERRVREAWPEPAAAVVGA